jgi:ABC-type transport system involved in multi-copper enzyme maturation permease subunit
MPIFDQGYQHWKGPLAGHAWRWLAIARHGVRVQLTSKIVWGLLILAWLPAIGLVAAVAIWGMVERQSAGVLSLVKSILPDDMLVDPHAYRTSAWTIAYSSFFTVEMYIIMLLVVVTGPGLISRDLRFNALPLYFARPLTRLDYFIGKLGVIGALVAGVAVLPALFAYIVGVSFSLDIKVVKDTYRVLLGSIAYGFIITLSVGLLMLALSTLSRRSVYVALMWFGIWWISSAVSGILTIFHIESQMREIVTESFRETEAEVRRLHEEENNSTDPKVRADRRKRIEQLQMQAFEKINTQGEEAWAKTVHTNWRTLPSFTGNLDRLGHGLLDTDSAWVQIGRAVEQGRQAINKPMRLFGIGGRGPKPPPINERRLADQIVPQYPWWWSGAVLAGLMGISACILSRRVKSLDRLK